MKKTIILQLIILATASLQSALAEDLYHEVRPLMHTFVEIKAYGTAGTPRIIDGAFSEIQRINSLLNNYDPESEISAINKAAGGKPVHVSIETYRALSDAKAYARISRGAFDFTIAPLVKLWGFNRENPGPINPEPGNDAIQGARQLVDYRALHLQKTSRAAFAGLPRSGMHIDTGAFGKGVAAEYAIGYLKEQGLKSALVAAGGTITAIGLKPDGKTWQIGIRHPRVDGSFLTIISLRNQSVSTSGDYEKFYYKGGKRRTHIIDPRTGMPVSTIQSVTVIAPRASTSDALSTALFVLGPEQGLEIIEKEKGVEALMVTTSGEIVYSSGWPQKKIIY